MRFQNARDQYNHFDIADCWGLNWGLVGLANFDLVAALFGEMSPLSRLVYLLVGLSALWQIVPLVAAPKTLATR